MKTTEIRLPRRTRSLILFSVLLAAILFSVMARAETVTLAWDANAEIDLAGYRLHYGTASGNYSNSVDVGNVTQYTLDSLSGGQTYYFAATAYNASGNQSGYSNEVSYAVPSPNGAPATPAVPSGPSGALVGEAASFSTSTSDPNGDVLSYRFDWGNGVISAWGAAVQSHSWASAGQFAVKAQARDDMGAESAWSNAKTVTISLNGTPTTPAIPSGASSALVGEVVSFSTSASDPNGDALSYRFDWGNGVISAWGAAGQSHSWAAAGQFAVKAQARDSRGAESGWSSAKNVTISLNGAPTTPAIPSGASTALVSEVVSFSTSASDPNGDALSYRFDWGNGVISAWGAAGQSYSWAAAGQFAVKAQARDSRGAESGWSNAKAVTIAASTPVNPDTDGDGVPDSVDKFPNDPNEWADANNNGTGDNADAAALTLQAPDLLSPINDGVIDLPLLLETGPFKSAVAGTTHSETQWQVFRDDDSSCVLDVRTALALTALKVPKLVLDEATEYFWRAQFIDSRGVASEWSNYGYFSTANSNADLNADGIPDLQEADTTVDLDRDGVKDYLQSHIKSLKMEGKRVLMGVSIKDCPNSVAIEYVESEDPSQEDAYASTKPRRMPFGLINFRVAVARPGDTATVKIHFSDAAPRYSRWYKYDPLSDSWYDFSALARFASDRRAITLTLTDGGNGDADGVANGVIVDPAGLVEIDEVISGSSSGGNALSEAANGCFIDAATAGANLLPGGLGLLIAAALALAGGRKKKVPKVTKVS